MCCLTQNQIALKEAPVLAICCRIALVSRLVPSESLSFLLVRPHHLHQPVVPTFLIPSPVFDLASPPGRGTSTSDHLLTLLLVNFPQAALCACPPMTLKQECQGTPPRWRTGEGTRGCWSQAEKSGKLNSKWWDKIAKTLILDHDNYFLKNIFYFTLFFGLLTPFTHFSRLPPHCLWLPPICHLYLWACFFCLL